MQNSVLFSFLSTSLLWQNLFLSKFEVLYWLVSLSLPTKWGNEKKSKGSFKVVPCSHEPLFYATLLSHPHTINPANLLTCSRDSVIWMVSYTVGIERGSLAKDVWAFNFEKSLTLPSFPTDELPMCFLCSSKIYDFGPVTGTLFPLIIWAGWRVDCWCEPLAHLLPYVVFNCKYSCLEWHACVNTEQVWCKAHDGIWNTVVQKHWNLWAWFQILPGRCFLRSLHLVF